ncbi:type II toxin-antitoxin system RelE/ParE family toxin [Agrobacterium vaccinii]|uniref:type II toxin-antitoxin system RelE/ParE family toxin n=1 Tax=Agrobacterium vaccinii TaxID=2735528 RepID=UPI001E461C28|nr:type II toxin-antitoxin system RelE/ParE family toxin [Agrobacterium vaccinii]UHS60646.1 type II toxin-antitoxin system RelE/ParE family toxin [Agrobacterium vaccinii]
MTYQIFLADKARDDIMRLYRYLLDYDKYAAQRAYDAIQKGNNALGDFPMSFRKVDPVNPFLRELIIPFGSSGYVVLFEVETSEKITILAIRHQREDDYH